MTKSNPVLNLKKIQNMYKFSSMDTAKYIHYEFEPILKVVEDKITSEAIKQSLSRYLILRSITLIEEFFKNTIAYYIDDFQFESKGLFKESTLTVPLNQLELLKNKTITLGRVISSSFNFQNPDDINFVMSKILGIKFFEKIEKIFSNHAEFAKKQNREDNHIKWDEFLELFDLRNSIAHSMNPSVQKSIDELRAIRYGILLFLGCAKTLLAIKLFSKESKLDEKFAKLQILSGVMLETLEKPSDFYEMMKNKPEIQRKSDAKKPERLSSEEMQLMVKDLMKSLGFFD